MPTAIVTGATGMTGGAVLHHLVQNHSYTKVYALSRSKQVHDHAKVEHARLDLRSDADIMAKDLAGVSADYVFFCAYLAHDDLDELTRINCEMLSNFLLALHQTGAIKQLKRFILTCGFKQYDVHLGRVKQPCEETDPLLVDKIGGVSAPWPSNFYYDQQKILADAARNSHWDWVCTLPEDVIGFAKHNFMNEATAIGLYCAVSKVLPGSALPFPGNRDNYLTFNTWTSSNVNAQFSIWAATAPNAGNNIFNVINGDTESFQNLWPKLAQRFGCKVPDPMFTTATSSTPTETQTKGFKDFEPVTTKMPTQHPLAANAKTMGLSNDPLLQDQPTLRCQIDPEKWAKRPDVTRAWETLRDKYGLDQSAWDTATWSFLTFAMGRDWNCVGSMSKARKFGWTGYADTWDEFESTFRALERERVLPPAEQLRRDF